MLRQKLQTSMFRRKDIQVRSLNIKGLLVLLVWEYKLFAHLLLHANSSQRASLKAKPRSLTMGTNNHHTETHLY